MEGSTTCDKAKGERGAFLNQRQCQLIAEFLETGEVPLMTGFKKIKPTAFGFENLRQFKTWAFRMYLDHGVLRHKHSGKIIIPKEMFISVIKDIHCAGQENPKTKQVKHLSAAATLEKIQKKYTTGKRSFGMSEDLVKSVVRICRSGSCNCNPKKNKLKNQKALKWTKTLQDPLKQENHDSSSWKKLKVKNLIKTLRPKPTTASSQTVASCKSVKQALSTTTTLSTVDTHNSLPQATHSGIKPSPYPLSLFRYTPQGFVCEPLNTSENTSQGFKFVLPNQLHVVSTTGNSNNVLNNPCNVPPVVRADVSNQNCPNVNSLSLLPSNTMTSSTLPTTSNNNVNGTDMKPSASNNVMYCVIPLNTLVPTSVASTVNASTSVVQKPLLASMLQNQINLKNSDLSQSMPGTSVSLSKRASNKSSGVAKSGTKIRLKAKITNSSVNRKSCGISKQDACRNLTNALNKCSKNILKKINVKLPEISKEPTTVGTTVHINDSCDKGSSVNKKLVRILKKEKVDGNDIEEVILIDDEKDEHKSAIERSSSKEKNMNEVVNLKPCEGDDDVRIIKFEEGYKRPKTKMPNAPKPGPLPHPPIWYYCNDLVKQTNCYSSLLVAIHDIKMDIPKTYLRDMPAMERVKRKICYAETLVKKLKVYTEQCKKY